MARPRETYWFALKVFYNKVEKVKADFKAARYETYVPMTVIEKFQKGELEYIEKPVVASLLFVRCSEKFLQGYKRENNDEFLYYTAPGDNKPARIKDREMDIFRQATMLAGSGAEYLGSETSRWCIGDRFKVTQGLYSGLEGYVKRIKHARKFIVCIEGVAAVSISSIHPKFLERIEAPGKDDIN